MPVILWTDALIFMLVIIVIASIAIGVFNEETRKRWRKVYQHPSRMIAMVLLLVFAIIGILDSMHYKTNDHGITVASVLDWILRPISNEIETSYSAPFATHLFVKQMVKDEQGNISWNSPKLQYVSAVPIWSSVVIGLSQALIFWILCSAVLWLLLVRKYNLDLLQHKPWGIAWITFGIVLAIIFICGHLIQHYHIFGTDKIGIDVFYSSLKSIRTGLIIGILTTIITLPFAVLFGAMAGYYRGWIDDLIQYLYTTLSSIPAVLLIAAAMLSLDALISRHIDYFALTAQRADIRLLLLCTILGITSWTTLCRILRGETLKLREQEFILASRVMGLRNIQIIIKHVFPNLLHIILISLVLDFSGLVLAEAVLSYVGVGVDASTFSWGNMINGARMEMGRDPIIWWSLVGAFVLMFILVLAANIFADGVREAFDPRVE